MAPLFTPVIPASKHRQCFKCSDYFKIIFISCYLKQKQEALDCILNEKLETAELICVQRPQSLLIRRQMHKSADGRQLALSALSDTLVSVCK